MNYITKLNSVSVSEKTDSQLRDTDSVPSTFRTFLSQSLLPDGHKMRVIPTVNFHPAAQ